ncbi:MAG: SGNH/GDSL hydrolase family protein [Verrucomicrobia bacterium]|nr:SGNH/GDSL hydrolase family protein [Verrucomicrobiota bacterium]MBU1733669.1 SGNH/GDSL hydrolase family protein [Verrucomicrobiota bacterium]MBU1857209.1 SGNH/GDSL hydrolase family protein [Verrucomicrobiota bacterium]
MKKKFVQVVMMGDSITWSSNVPFGQRYGDYIEQELQAHLGDRVLVDVAICGDGGDTVGQALERLERDVLVYDPDAVLINLGGNNMLREINYAEKDLHAIVGGIRKQCPQARIILETVPTVIEKLHCYRKHPDIIKAGGLMRILKTRTHRMIRRVAKQYELPLHDRFGIFQAAVAKQKNMNDQLICKDGIHLTVAGNRYFALSAAKTLTECLESLPKLPAKSAVVWLRRAETNPAFSECCRALREGGLELFLRSAGTWVRLMLQQARSCARRAECLATNQAMRSLAKRVAALAAAFSALQRALPGEFHQPLPSDKVDNITWALTQLKAAPRDHRVDQMQKHLRTISYNPR